jgi:hypothetical protein
MEASTYLIAVEIEALMPLADVRAGLQAAYDAGADGRFQILPTMAPGFMILFLRTTSEDDASYLLSRMNAEVDVRQSARLQLAEELCSAENAATLAVVAALRSGEGARCVEFGGSGLDAVQAMELAA